MSKILAIDYGLKRSGLAETDDLQMMAFGLSAMDSEKVIPYLKKYAESNTFETVVVGLSLNLQGELNEIENQTQKFIKELQKEFPHVNIIRQDERFTSVMAERSIREMGKNKKARQNKYLVDEVSATLILQSYLDKKDYDFTN